MLARDNPFATDRVEALLHFNPEWSGTTWENLDKKWESLGRRATVTGRHGAGKTCFLDAWTTRHEHITGKQPIRIFLNREQTTITNAQWEVLAQRHGKTIILDGEEQLGYRARIRFYNLAQNAFGTLVTRHSSGKLPNLLHLAPGLEALTRCIRKLAPEQYQQLTPQLPELWRKHRGNIRHILLECYDKVT